MILAPYCAAHTPLTTYVISACVCVRACVHVCVRVCVCVRVYVCACVATLVILQISIKMNTRIATSKDVFNTRFPYGV